MKKVLMVAYQFAPSGGSGVQRSVKFAKYLPSYGWEPVILTRDADGIKLRDESLMKEIPNDMEIIRTHPCDLTALPGLLSKAGKFIAWKLMIPDGEVLWMRGALKSAMTRLEKGDIDALYTTSYPFSDHLMGLEIKNCFPDMPWVADFRDEWTNNPYYLDKPHSAWRMAKESAMEKQVLSGASHLIANTPVMHRNFIYSNPDLNLDKRMTVIPNGFDPRDFERSMDEIPRNERLTVTYTGSLYGRRKPDTFLEAVGNLVRSGIIQADTLRIRFIGNIKQGPINRMIERNGLVKIVEVIPYMEHEQCIECIQRSDILLLIEGGKGSDAFYTGKLFEYIQAKKPIFALIPSNGAAANLIRETRTGIVCDWSDIKCIEQGFISLYSYWTNHTLKLNPDEQEIRKYDRFTLTGKLAHILDGLENNGLN